MKVLSLTQVEVPILRELRHLHGAFKAGLGSQDVVTRRQSRRQRKANKGLRCIRQIDRAPGGLSDLPVLDKEAIIAQGQFTSYRRNRNGYIGTVSDLDIIRTTPLQCDRGFTCSHQTTKHASIPLSRIKGPYRKNIIILPKHRVTSFYWCCCT